MNVIPCTAWVKRGVAAATPEKVQLTPQELEGIIKQTQAEIENLDTDSDNETNENASLTNTNGESHGTSENDEFNFANYDNEGGDIQCHIGGLAVINPDGKDPYVTVGDSEDEDSEKDDDIIKPDDNLVLFGRVEGDASILEVYVYNEREDSFYCHHDILLPSFPLCIEWLNFDPSDSKPGNLCAIGNMTSVIDVWDLDVVDCLEPAFKLGCKPSKKKNKKRVGHKDAVLDIAWNTNYSHVLASGSVDQTILLWDLENGTPVTKLEQFNEKVQSIQWHPQENQQLLTGCADKCARIFDCRVDDTFKTWEATGEVEKILWNHFDTNYFYLSTNNGNIECIDIRQSKHLWEIVAHEKEITGLSLSLSCPGLLVTSSDDGVIKVWDAIKPEILEPVWEKKTNLGALQCLAPCPDNPFVFVVGGDHKSHNYKVWNLLEVSAVSDRFKDRELIQTKISENSNGNNTNEFSEEMMDVTDDIESMALQTASSNGSHKKKKNSK
ncbi:hypothetical protein PV328_000620 [Microctonus aethiopoides]|uniref:Periodic tryptophan protein 1 n=1 Tax=Microctonus aethiopoides TaxID=144406 RepID=A0AA39FVA1_9HYME|nr:hypothetical protein PV328_000620 [Microctonus aethiopoides]